MPCLTSSRRICNAKVKFEHMKIIALQLVFDGFYKNDALASVQLPFLTSSMRVCNVKVKFEQMKIIVFLLLFKNGFYKNDGLA